MKKIIIKNITIGNTILGEGPPKICVPLVGTDAKRLLAEITHAEKQGGDILEWRADYYHDPSLKGLKQVLSELNSHRSLPLLLTLRSISQGGRDTRSHQVYFQDLMELVSDNQVDLLDVELHRVLEWNGAKEFLSHWQSLSLPLLMSHHDFENTPGEQQLKAIYAAMDNLGADIGKVAVMPETIQDVERLMQIAGEWKDSSMGIVAIAMGELGERSRCEAADFGGCMTFASGLEASAPGQMSIERIKACIKE